MSDIVSPWPFDTYPEPTIPPPRRVQTRLTHLLNCHAQTHAKVARYQSRMDELHGLHARKFRIEDRRSAIMRWIPEIQPKPLNVIRNRRWNRYLYYRHWESKHEWGQIIRLSCTINSPLYHKMTRMEMLLTP